MPSPRRAVVDALGASLSVDKHRREGSCQGLVKIAAGLAKLAV